jgi:uncharacterized protein (TIGR03083 family)
MTDYGGAYHDLRVRLTDLVKARPEQDLERVPVTTPQWRVRDVVAHLAGVCDDITTGNLHGVATDEWTAAQVAKRRAWPFDKVLTLWDEHAIVVEPQLNDLPPVAIGQMLFDAVTHEQDVRGALGEPGGRDAAAMDIVFDWGIARLSERFVRDGLGTLRIATDVGTHDVGSGDPVATLRATRFELVRAMTGRRSKAQVRAYDGTADVEPEHLLLSTELFTMPDSDIVE